MTGGEDVSTTRRHRSLEAARLRPAAIRRGRARRARARRVRRRRARRCDHLEPATRRQRDHHRDGRATDRDSRDDRGPSLHPRRHHHRRRYTRILGRQRSAPTQGHDQGGLAPAASGLRPHALHAAAATQADLRRRERDRIRRRLRDRPEHRLHHRLRKRHLRPARGDDRTRGRRRVTRFPPTRAASGESAADADDRRPDHRGRGPPPGDGQRDLPAGGADGRRAPDRSKDREQLADGRTGGQGRRPHG